ncbi:MAG: hypothetical protein QXX41_06560, partial [Nitrososphaerota archaeon]
ADAVAAKIMGVNPRSVAHIRLAEKEGLGKTTFIVKGADLEYFRRRFPQNGLSEKALAFGYKVAYKLGFDKRLT